MKQKNWHKSSQNQISAPLILDPVEGEMTNEMKSVCKKFEEVTGFRVAVQTRAGRANKQLAKSEPLRRKKCNCEDCCPCTTRGGKCQKNGAGYEIRCETCLRDGKLSMYADETGRNSYTRGMEHLDALQ